jgi:branched-chain amino acid transport system substrate-binding protein
MCTSDGPRVKARAISKLGVALCCLAALVAAGCGGDDDSGGGEKSGKPILVGAAVALTGDEAPFDEPPMQAFQQAAEEVNAQGGVNGRKLDVVVRDMKSDPSLASRVTTDLINQGAELVIVPCDPDLGAPGAIVAQQKGIISFSLCEASARFGPQGIGKYVYTPSHITYLEGYVMAEWAQMKLKLSRAFVIEDKTFAGYDGEVCKGFRNRWEGLGGETVGSDTLSADDKSIASTVTRITDSNPDFVYMCSQPPGSPGWIRQIRAAGLDMPILMATATDGNYWLNAVPNLSDVFYPSMGSIYGDDPNSRVNEFVETFTKKQGDPPQTAYALFGAAVMDLWKKAVEQAKTTDAEPVRKALDSFRNVDTLVGSTTYTDTAHIALDRPMLIMEIQNGKIRYSGETWKVKKAPTLTG